MWRSYAALAAARLGEPDRARELIEEELEIARRFGAPEPIGEALRVRALLAPSADMVELAREAVDVLAGSELRVAHARALIDLGAALRRGGHRRDAREPLREGLDLANRCGSVVETDRAMDELRATGARPRRPAVRGVDSLSAQERRVAAMAAEGLSNREIAEALFLTRRTVEMHLTGAYRKLDVSGRAELPAALATSEMARRDRPGIDHVHLPVVRDCWHAQAKCRCGSLRGNVGRRRWIQRPPIRIGSDGSLGAGSVDRRRGAGGMGVTRLVLDGLGFWSRPGGATGASGCAIGAQAKCWQ